MPSRFAAAFDKAAAFALDWRLFLDCKNEQVYALWLSLPPDHPSVCAAAAHLRTCPVTAHRIVLDWLRSRRIERLCPDSPFIPLIVRAVLRAARTGGRPSTFLPTQVPPAVLLVAWRALPPDHAVVHHLAREASLPPQTAHRHVLERLRVYAGH